MTAKAEILNRVITDLDGLAETVAEYAERFRFDADERFDRWRAIGRDLIEAANKIDDLRNGR